MPTEPITAGAASSPAQRRSLRAFLATQALGAFNDNVFKQVVLLLAVGYTAGGTDFQTVVQAAFALPFLLFSGLAGDLSDRFGKGRLMVLCKVAEIVVMLAGLAVFAGGGLAGASGAGVPAFLWALVGVTFLMGTQSTFFGPPKYGGLPELVTARDLPRATGLTQLTTFVAIILGVAVAGWLVDVCGDRLWMVGGAAVLIAAAGTWTSRGIERRPAADPSRRIGAASFTSAFRALRATRREDPTLWSVMLAYSWFWLLGGVCLVAANSFGLLQLGLSNLGTSLLISTISLGIGLGSALAGRLQRAGEGLRLVRPGAIALVATLLLVGLLPVHAPTAAELARFAELKSGAVDAQTLIPAAGGALLASAFGLFLLLGGAAGFFSVPLLTFVQERPSAADKGRVFAAVNWLNWVFILLSALVYGVGMSWLESRAHHLLAWMGLFTGIVVLALSPRLRR